MNRRSIAIAIAVLVGGLAIAPLPASAQAAPAGGADLKTRMASILERFPAETAAARDALCAEVVKLGPAALAEACARVLPPGAGNDAKARFAVNGLAVHVTRAGAEAERLLFVKTLLAAIAASPDKNVAAFFITQVRLAGSTEAVKPLAAYLKDEFLAGPAAGALQTIGGLDAARALVAALDKAPRTARLSIVDALGAMRSREAVKKLLPMAGGADEGLRRAARAALADIGDPAAGPVLSQVLVTGSHNERAEAPGLYLLFARRLAGSGRTSDALAAARALLGSYDRPAEGPVATEALSLVVSLLGEKALPDLLLAARSSGPALRGAALETAAGLGQAAATGSWIDQARSADAALKAPIVVMLGRRGDPGALPFIKECLGDPDEAVRLAAIPAAVRLGGAAVIPDLFGRAGTAGPDEAAALKAALLQFKGDEIVPTAAGLVDATPHPGKAVLIDLLGEKGARREFERVFALAADADPATRAAAMGALAKLAGERDLPGLVDRLEKATDGDDIVNLQNAVAAAALRNADPARRGAGLVDLMTGASPARKIVILRVLPKVGGTKAMSAAVTETSDPEAQVQTAAVYALSQWPDYVAAGDLLRIATTTASKRYRLLAVDGYVRLVGRAGMTGQRKLALFQDLMVQSFDDADKKAVLTGAAAIREPESLRLLAGYLDHPALGDTATAGLLELASEQAPQERWLSGHEAYSVLRRVEARTADPAERARVDDIIAARLRQGGFSPLFDGRGLAGWKGLVADPPARAKMSPQELATAQAAADERMRAHWRVVDGALVFDGGGESLCTASDYGDFELLVDWKIEPGGDSGLYLRGSPRSRSGTPIRTRSAPAAFTTTRKARARLRKRPTARSGNGIRSGSS